MQSSPPLHPTFGPHGNQVSWLTKVAGSSYWVAPQRSFDPWGNLRLGSAGNQPNGRYCASIGHENDDENAMTYMRARYYDQASGRFISEDPGGQGLNWFTYCANDPVQQVDYSGKVSSRLLWGSVLAAIGWIDMIKKGAEMGLAAKLIAICGTAMIICWFWGDHASNARDFLGFSTLLGGAGLGFLGIQIWEMFKSAVGAPVKVRGVAEQAWGAVMAYCAVLGLFMALQDLLGGE